MLKKIITFILNFLLFILVFGLICIILISNTVLNKQYILGILEKNNFYERTYHDIKDTFENYTMQSGLELSILDNLVSLDKIKSDINMVISSIYEKDDAVIETKDIKTELDNRINKVLQENNKTPSKEELNSIEKYENSICEAYKDGILYVQIHISPTLLEPLRNIVIISIIIIALLIIIINKNLNKILNIFGTTLLTSGILSVSIKFLTEKKLQKILIMDQKFSNCLRYGINDVLESFFKVGSLLIIVGFLIILATNIIFSIFLKKCIVNNNK